MTTRELRVTGTSLLGPLMMVLLLAHPGIAEVRYKCSTP